MSLSLSFELDSEVEGVGLSFWSEFRGILLIFLDFWSGFRIAGELRLTFPMTLIYFLHEIPKVIQILGFVEVNQLILDPFWKGEVGFPMKDLIVVVKESREQRSGERQQRTWWLCDCLL